MTQNGEVEQVYVGTGDRTFTIRRAQSCRARSVVGVEGRGGAADLGLERHGRESAETEDQRREGQTTSSFTGADRGSIEVDVPSGKFCHRFMGANAGMEAFYERIP